MTGHLNSTRQRGTGEGEVCVGSACAKHDNSIAIHTLGNQSAVCNSIGFYSCISALAKAYRILLYIKGRTRNGYVVAVIEVDAANSLYGAVLNKNTVNALELTKRVRVCSCGTTGNSQILVTAGVGLNANSAGNVKGAVFNGYVAGIAGSICAVTESDASISGNAVSLEYYVLNGKACRKERCALTVHSDNARKSVAVAVNGNTNVSLLGNRYVTLDIVNKVNGKTVWNNEKKSVSVPELKSMVEFYKTKGRDSVMGQLGDMKKTAGEKAQTQPTRQKKRAEMAK